MIWKSQSVKIMRRLPAALMGKQLSQGRGKDVEDLAQEKLHSEEPNVLDLSVQRAVRKHCLCAAQQGL